MFSNFSILFDCNYFYFKYNLFIRRLYYKYFSTYLILFIYRIEIETELLLIPTAYSNGIRNIGITFSHFFVRDSSASIW